MVSVLFLILGSIDLIAGLMLTFSSITFLPWLAKYIGLALIVKGIWTLLTSLAS